MEVSSKIQETITWILASLFGLFVLAWIIVGSVWLFTDEDCFDGEF